MTAEDLCYHFPTYFVCHRQLAILTICGLVFTQQTMPVMGISCASFLLGECSTRSCSSGHAMEEASYRNRASSFERNVTSREDMLITESEEIYKFMEISEQIPLISSEDLPH